MIKTVSFAPPRSASSRSTAKSSSAPRTGAKRAASGSSASAQTSLDFSDAPLQVEASVIPAAPKVAARAKKAEVSAPAPTSVSNPAQPKTEVKPEVKARKPRVPKDLATQYGENPTKRPEVVPIIESETPRKRLNKAERAARRELIKPDEGLLARLARASQVAIVKPKAVPRGKGWKFECGRCGQTSYFETRGALCVCGAIAIKE